MGAGVVDVVYRPVIRAALGVFRLLDLQIEVQGKANIPADGGAVIAANHVSYLDFMLVGFAARPQRFVRFMAKKSVFDSRVSGPLMRSMGHIPVDRAAGADAYRAAVDAVRRGELVGVFPESTISRSFMPRAMRKGAARIALAAAAPLLPVVTWGGQRIWTTGRRPALVRHVPITIVVGPPLDVTRRDPEHLTSVLRRTLTRMVDDVARSYPRPAPSEDDWWFPAHLGGGAPTPEQADPIEIASIGRTRA